MSYEQFWEDDPCLAKFYRRADEIKRKRMNEELWLAGIYVADALTATVGNMFTKGQKYQYPSEPKPITRDEVEARAERERQRRMEKIKAAFTAKALSVNAKMGVEA